MDGKHGLHAAALLGIVCLASGPAQADECSAEAPATCQAECDGGRAVACHIVGEQLLGGAFGHEQQDGRAVPLIDGNTLQRAATAFRRACEGEFTWSCYKLAEIEPMRKTHWRDLGLAHDRRLCNRDDKPWACTRLGLMYKNGKLVDKNDVLAARLFEKSCAKDDINACAHLGSLWLLRKAKRKAGIDHLQRGCDSGIAWSCMWLAGKFRTGEFVAKDITRAQSLLQAACDLANQEGCVLLGVLLHREQVGGGSDEAARLFRRACDVDVQSGCVNLGDLYELGQGVPQDLRTAARLFEHGCNRYVGGCVRAGILYDEGRGVAQNPGKAREYFQTGCDNKDSNACFRLALSLRDGRGGIPDPREAASMLRNQCDLEARALACQILADMHEKGFGVPKNRVTQRRLLARACQLGRQQACSVSTTNAAR